MRNDLNFVKFSAGNRMRRDSFENIAFIFIIHSSTEKKWEKARNIFTDIRWKTQAFVFIIRQWRTAQQLTRKNWNIVWKFRLVVTTIRASGSYPATYADISAHINTENERMHASVRVFKWTDENTPRFAFDNSLVCPTRCHRETLRGSLIEHDFYYLSRFFRERESPKKSGKSQNWDTRKRNNHDYRRVKIRFEYPMNGLQRKFIDL